MSWEYFILFAVVALVCWSLGAFAARKENGMGIRIYSVGIGCIFLFYPRHVGFFGTSSDADNGRDTFVVFFLSAVGWIDNVYTLEV